MRTAAFAAAVIVFVYIVDVAFAQTASETARVGTITGNWVVRVDRKDGTYSKQYFNLKQDGGRITGTVRSTQFFYTITESAGDASALWSRYS